MYTQLCSRFLFPLHERLKGHSSVALRRDLERAQWLGPQALADLQLRRLTAFLRNAVQDVPYYGAQFAALGLRVDDIRSLDDLRHLPFLTKPLIREHTEQLKSKRARRLVRYNTGGSTGEPLVFYMGIERISHLDGDVEHLPQVERPARQPAIERLAIEQLHGEIQLAFVFVEAVDGADVGMVER